MRVSGGGYVSSRLMLFDAALPVACLMTHLLDTTIDKQATLDGDRRVDRSRKDSPDSVAFVRVEHVFVPLNDRCSEVVHAHDSSAIEFCRV